MPEINVIAEYIPSRTITAQFIPVNFDIPAKLIEKTIQVNGVYNASDDNADGYSSVTVVVPATPVHIQELTITPTTQAQTINVTAGIDGYGPVNVSAVENVLPENIKQGETILGVQGTVVELNGETVNISPTTSQQIIEPTSPKNAITRATVAPVTSAIDANIQPENIKQGVSILGTSGTLYVPDYYVSLTKFYNTSGENVLFHNYTRSNLIDFTGINTIAEYVLTNAYAPYYSDDTNTSISGPIDMSSVKTIENYGCFNCFKKCINITSVNLSSLKSVATSSCYNMFYKCSSLTSANLSSLEKNIAQYGLAYMFQDCTSLTSVNISKLEVLNATRTCVSMFQGCSSLENIDLSGLRTVNATYTCASMFQDCTSLKDVDVSSLIQISNEQAASNMFNGCTSLTSIDFSALTSITGMSAASAMFLNCTALTDVNLSLLTGISGNSVCSGMFGGCTSLTNIILPSLTNLNARTGLVQMFLNSGVKSVFFPSLRPTSFGSSYTNQFNKMLLGVTGCTVHFPNNLQSVIGSWADVIDGFGGTNTTILYDLPATVTLTGADTVTYTRNPKYDTATALAWKVGAYGTTNFDPTYYTSGTTDPVVGNTLYSDAACTTSVTTISSIA